MIQLHFPCTRVTDRFPLTFHEQSERAHTAHIQKQVNVYRAILKTSILSENVVPSQFTGKR